MAGHIEEPGPHLHCDTLESPGGVSVVTCANYPGGSRCFVTFPKKRIVISSLGGEYGENVEKRSSGHGCHLCS